MKEGACDYLMKPVSFVQLEEAAQRILGRTSEWQDEHAPEFVGESPVFQALIAKARRVALTEADILIEAESGTGKELLARLIHRASPRASKPFVAVNCSAFPENLLESELFGHVRGAFTGAIAAKPGKFQLADGGTLLLDEIGEMPLSLQPKLLRVLQEREIDRLGDTHPLPINVRVIATTNRSLPALIEAGTFRADLYYRLNVIPLSMPPLHERREDIVELANHFLRKYEPKTQRRQFHISPELAAALQDYDWPGNIRELENFIRRALALTHRTTLGVELFGSMAQSPSPSSRPAEAGCHAARCGAFSVGSYAACHPWKSHAHRRDDGRKPAHGSQQNSRIRPSCKGGSMSWIHSMQVDLLERFMDLSAKRQSLITSNIANVDTPGYRTKDIDFQGELQRALQGGTRLRPNLSCGKCRAWSRGPTATTSASTEKACCCPKCSCSSESPSNCSKSQFKNVRSGHQRRELVYMNLFRVLEISGSALLAERQRAEVVTSNLANAETTHTANGGPYQRMHVVFGAHSLQQGAFPATLASFTDMHAEGVHVARVVPDGAPPVRRFEPGHPDADDEGYVSYPGDQSGRGNGEPDGRRASVSTERRGGAEHQEHDSVVDRHHQVVSEFGRKRGERTMINPIQGLPQPNVNIGCRWRKAGFRKSGFWTRFAPPSIR